MRRHALGVIAIAFIAGAAFLWFRYSSNDDMAFAMAVCLRVGMLLCALWLALPQLEQLFERFPPWVVAGIGLGGLLVAVRPKLIFYIAPILAAMAVVQGIGWLFKPLPRTPRKRPTAKESPPQRTQAESGRADRRR